MNILHVGKYYPPYHGGMETFLKDLSEALAEKDHNITVLVHNHSYGNIYSKSEQSRHKNVDIIRQSSLKPILFTPIMLGLRKKIHQLFSNPEPPELIHISWPNPSALFLLLSPDAKTVPWILQWHSDMVTKSSSWFLKIAHFFFSPFEKLLLKRCQTVVTSTHEYAQHSKTLKPFLSKVTTIPIGLNTNSVIPNSQYMHKNPKFKNTSHLTLKIFSLGRLTFYKNHMLLIEALKHQKNWELIITGAGNLYNHLTNIIKKNNLQKQVQLTGSLSKNQINNLYKQCDVFCLPSNDRAESYGLVLLEAMAHNCIILTSDTKGSGMQWLANRYAKGYCFQNNNLSDLINKLEKIHTNLLTIQQKKTCFDLTIDKTASMNEKLYKKTLSNK